MAFAFVSLINAWNVSFRVPLHRSNVCLVLLFLWHLSRILHVCDESFMIPVLALSSWTYVKPAAVLIKPCNHLRYNHLTRWLYLRD